MRSPTHLHSSSTLLLATVSLLLAGVGVVQAQQPSAVPRGQSERLAAVTQLMTLPAPAPPAPTTTTTTAPPPPPPTTTTTVPVTVPPTTPKPRATTTTAAPTPVAAAAPVAPVDGPAYAMGLVQQVVPATWLAKVPVHIQIIAGKTSWSSWGGLIEIDEWHLFKSSVAHAQNTLAHEWGHQVAWLYGTDVYNGAPPAGFPASGAEQWADCVAEALTGTSYPSSGLGRCPAAALSFTSSFLAAGPGTPLR
jgi:hypothetical protein